VYHAKLRPTAPLRYWFVVGAATKLQQASSLPFREEVARYADIAVLNHTDDLMDGHKYRDFIRYLDGLSSNLTYEWFIKCDTDTFVRGK
jgi:hypothetical protein